MIESNMPPRIRLPIRIFDGPHHVEITPDIAAQILHMAETIMEPDTAATNPPSHVDDEDREEWFKRSLAAERERAERYSKNAYSLDLLVHSREAERDAARAEVAALKAILRTVQREAMNNHYMITGKTYDAIRAAGVEVGQ